VLADVRDVGEVLNGGLARLRHGERPAVLLLVGGGERALARDGSGGYQEKSKGDELHGGGDTQVETERECKMQGKEHAARE
jgi:hypothetical protein